MRRVKRLPLPTLNFLVANADCGRVPVAIVCEFMSPFVRWRPRWLAGLRSRRLEHPPVRLIITVALLPRVDLGAVTPVYVPDLGMRRNPIEVVQDEKTREDAPLPLETAGHPGVQV
jgi:hypothetical protein